MASVLRQGWLATGKQAHNARKAKNNGHIWLKQDSELVKVIKEQARKQSMQGLWFPFHFDGSNYFRISPNETLFNSLTNQWNYKAIYT